MRSTPRLFLAALALISLISTAAFVRAQDSAVPAPAAPNAVNPRPQLPGIPATSLASPSTVANPAPPKSAANPAPAALIKTGPGGWILLGLAAVALFAGVSRYSRRIPKSSSIPPVPNLPLKPEPVRFRLN